MQKHLSLLLLAIAAFAFTPSFACDKGVACDKCAKDSEFSWNPENRFVTARLSRFYSLDDQIAAAYMANDFAKTKSLAKESLELADVYRCNWNYGNVIHDSNRFLGLISLKSGEVDTAADYLMKAGKSSGSPQLNSFGPELDLANELLKLGKIDAVKAYLKELKSFWEMNDGKLDGWLSSIEKGEKPDLNRFTVKEPGILLTLFSWLANLWPVLISTAFFYFQRKQIRKKVRFFVVGVLAGYALVFLVGWIGFYLLQKVMLSIDHVGDTLLSLMMYFPIGVAFLLPVLVNFGVKRVFSEKACE